VNLLPPPSKRSGSGAFGFSGPYERPLVNGRPSGDIGDQFSACGPPPQQPLWPSSLAEAEPAGSSPRPHFLDTDSQSLASRACRQTLQGLASAVHSGQWENVALAFHKTRNPIDLRSPSWRSSSKSGPGPAAADYRAARTQAFEA